MRRGLFIVFLSWLFAVAVQAEGLTGNSVDFSHGDLQVSPNGRYLQHADGTPFLYLGDTAWELLYRLDERQAEMYMENRRSKGFTVIQTVILVELDGEEAINRPLLNGSPLTPSPWLPAPFPQSRNLRAGNGSRFPASHGAPCSPEEAASARVRKPFPAPRRWRTPPSSLRRRTPAEASRCLFLFRL